MCVILDISKGVKIPQGKLELACDINKHGFGLAFQEKGRVKCIHTITEPNDYKLVSKELHKLNDRRVLLHLRHATVGAVNRANAHPLQVLTKHEDGIDLVMMHNGTLHMYSPPWDSKDKVTDSDTLLFKEQFARPLALRSILFSPKDKLLVDPFFRKLVTKEVGGFSVLVFMDNYGNVWKINEDKGKQFEGWWASNEYSFQESHYRSSKKNEDKYWKPPATHGPVVYQGVHANSVREFPWEGRKMDHPNISTWQDDVWFKGDKGFPEKEKKASLLVSNSKLVERYMFEIEQATKIIQASEIKDTSILTMMQNGTIENLSVSRPSFVEECGLKSIDDVLQLTEANLEEICENYPKAGAALIIDLLSELFAKKMSAARSVT